MADLELDKEPNPAPPDQVMEDQPPPNPPVNQSPVETTKKYDYTVKLRFTPKTNPEAEDPNLISSHLANFLTQVVTKVSKEVRFRDKNDSELSLTEFPMDPETIASRILYERANGNKQIHILLTIETEIIWHDFKSKLFPWLKNQNLYMDRHLFGKTEIRVSKLGFLTNVHPIQTHRQTLQAKINNAFDDEYEVLSDTERKEFYPRTDPPPKAPEIRVYVHQPSWTISTKKTVTQALAIECLQSDRAMVSNLLTHIFCGDGVAGRFIPFSLPYDVSRKNAEQEYVTVLQHHNLYLTSYVGIQIAGLHPEDLDHTYDDNLTLRQKILRQTGIVGLEPTAATPRIGKWNVQTTKTESATVSHFLDNELPKLIDNIPSRPRYFQYYPHPRRLRMSWTSQTYLNDMTTTAATTTKTATIDLTTPSAWKKGPPKNIDVSNTSQPSTTIATTTNHHLDTHIRTTTTALENLKTSIQAMQAHNRSELDNFRTTMAQNVQTIETVAKDMTASLATLKTDLHATILHEIQGTLPAMIQNQVQQALIPFLPPMGPFPPPGATPPTHLTPTYPPVDPRYAHYHPTTVPCTPTTSR